MSFLSLQDAELWYVQSGAGPDIVWVPGGDNVAEDWADQVSFFGSGFRNTAFDPRGAGKTVSRRDPPWSIEDMARDGTVRGTLLEPAQGSSYRRYMAQRSPFRYFKTSPEIIRLAVMLYIRFPLSLRNVEDLLHERGIEISHETVRFWWNRFGPMFAAEIRRRRVDRMRGTCQWRWHLDEVYVKINGVTHYLWRAVDHEGEVLESFVTKTRDRKAALKFLKKSMKRHGRPASIVTDKLRSYGAALKDLGRGDDRETERWLNNRAENSHLPFRRRERAMLRFRRMRSLQMFASVHASVHNHFNKERALHTRSNYKTARAAALAEWRGLFAA